MFLHTLIEKKEIDLDELVDKLKNSPEWVNYGIQIFGSLEYTFIVKCVEEQVQKIKEYTPMPIEEDTSAHD